MASEALINKWKLWYKSLDVNHDGKISKEDVEESRQKFTDVDQLGEEKKQYIAANFNKWWNEFIFKGKEDVEISEKDFVDSLNSEFKADKDKFNKKMNDCFVTLFNVIDTNQDRSISEDEFVFAFKAFGHENVALDTKFFKAYNPKEGLVPLNQIVESWVRFASKDENTDDDIVKKAFETGV